MPSDPNVHVGVAAWMEYAGQILLMHRGQNATHGANTWALPGGWVDYGEEPRQSIEREVQEELGVPGRATNVIDVVSNTYDEQGHVICIVYDFEQQLTSRGRHENLEPEKCDGIEIFTLSDLASLQEKELFPPLKTVLVNKGLWRPPPQAISRFRKDSRTWL